MDKPEAQSQNTGQGQMESSPRSLPSEITIGDKYGPAMEITNQAEADHCFEQLVRHNLQCRADRGEPQNVDEAVAIERQNLGYFAGYYNSNTRERVERLFRCAHPIFGAIAKNGAPSFKTAFEAGRKLAEGAPSVPVATDSSTTSY